MVDFHFRKGGSIKKAQGLPISTVILATIGLVVLIFLIAFVTGRLGYLGRGLSECEPQNCIGQYTGDTPEDISCDQATSRELTGRYILKGQEGVPISKLKKCSKCCISLL